MRNFFSIMLIIVAYCTPFILITVPVMMIAAAVRNHKAMKLYKEKQRNRGELPPPERNTHYGVDL